MVITVPDVVIPDWLEALANIGIPAADCQTIIDPKNISKIDINKIPTILLVKQSLTLSRNSDLHQMALEKLKAIYSLPRLHVFDEKTSASPTIAVLYDHAKQNPRLILSGTVVTNSVQDIGEQYSDSEQLGSSKINEMMSSLSSFFSRYFRSSFFGTHRSIPGDIFLRCLSLSTFMHTSLYSRFSSSLPITLPHSKEEFLSINPEDIAAHSAASETREEPSNLLTGVGASVTVDVQTNRLFFDNHTPHWYPTKLQRLVSECSAPRAPTVPMDILVVTASQKTSRQLLTELTPLVQSFKYSCIFIHDKKREEKVEAAHAAGLSVIFITESNRVEGFNIQKHLAKIIFFDAVREAGDYAQAIGRGVRRGNQSVLVEVKQYCTSQIANYVEKRIATTRKAKTLLELIHADPTAIFLLLTQDVLTRHHDLRPGVDFDLVLTSVHKALDVFAGTLQQISMCGNSQQMMIDLVGLLTCVHTVKFSLSQWRESYPLEASKLSQPFIHLFLFEENMSRFAFDAASTKQFTDIKNAINICKQHFLLSIQAVDLETLLQPQYLNLAHGFNLAGDYLLALGRCLEQAPSLTEMDAFNALKIVYSSTPGVFPERAMIHAHLLRRLKETDFFSRLTFLQCVQTPYLLFAYIDAHLDPRKSYEQLMTWFTFALKNHPKQAYQVLCQMSAYPSEHTRDLLDQLLPCLYDELERMADSAPGVVYTQECNDVLAMHFGRTTRWIDRLLTFAKTLTPDSRLRSNLIDRCKKLLNECSHTEQNALVTTHGELLIKPRLIKNPLEAVDNDPSDLAHKSKRSRVKSKTFTQGGAAATAASRPSPLQRHSLFNSSLNLPPQTPFVSTPANQLDTTLDTLPSTNLPLPGFFGSAKQVDWALSAVLPVEPTQGDPCDRLGEQNITSMMESDIPTDLLSLSNEPLSNEPLSNEPLPPLFDLGLDTSFFDSTSFDDDPFLRTMGWS